MALRIGTTDAGDVTILSLAGRLVAGEESNKLRDEIATLLAQGKKKFVLGLESVTFIDTAGIGALVSIHQRVRLQGGMLKLSSLQPKVQDVLQLARLTTVFEEFPNVQTAVESFGTHFGWSYCETHGRYPGTGSCPKCPK